MRHLLLLALAALATAPTGAQTPNVAGTWTVTYDADISGRGEKMEVKRRAQATLVLQQRGDSVFGVWHPIPEITAEVSGRVDGTTVRLGSPWRAGKVTRDGQPVDGAEMRSEFHGTLQGGGMAGTMYVRVRVNGAEREPPPRKWEAVRRAAG